MSVRAGALKSGWSAEGIATEICQMNTMEHERTEAVAGLSIPNSDPRGACLVLAAARAPISRRMAQIYLRKAMKHE